MKDKNNDEQDINIETPEDEGEESAFGSASAPNSDDDVGEMVEEVTGEEPVPGKPFSIAKEVEDDEKAVHDIPPDEANLTGAVDEKDTFGDE